MKVRCDVTRDVKVDGNWCGFCPKQMDRCLSERVNLHFQLRTIDVLVFTNVSFD